MVYFQKEMLTANKVKKKITFMLPAEFQECCQMPYCRPNGAEGTLNKKNNFRDCILPPEKLSSNKESKFTK
jgi:hypothetical protein